jgi:hypothetical protein
VDIRENLKLFVMQNEIDSAILKFSYLGNVQYHSLSSSDLKKLSLEFNKILEEGN